MKRRALLVALVLLVLSVACARAQTDMRADVGYEGIVPGGRWFPLRIAIEHDGEALDALVAIDLIHNNLDTYDRYEFPVRIEPGTTRASFPIRYFAPQWTLAVTLHTGEVVIAQAQAEAAEIIGSYAYLVGVLGGSDALSASLTEVGRENLLGRMEQFAALRLTDALDTMTAKELDGFSALVIDDVDVGALDAAQQALAQRQGLRSENQERIRALTQEIDALHEQLAQDQDKGHKAEMILSRTQAELTQMQQRIWDEYELTYAGAKEYLTEPFDLAASDRRTGDIRREIRAMGPVNVTAVEDYRACRERYEELAGQRNDLLKAEDDLKGIIDTLQRQMERQFMENFRLMQQYFAETFAKLFGGGHAELRLLDEKDVLNCGIEIVAQPPGKKLQLLSLLSGGERALTAIAILFAMLRLKPTPFCFLDEIEAALDDGNISTFADYLREFSTDTQFVVVTHRKGTMERCDSLYGVAMEEKGVSTMLSVELKDVGEDAMQ